MQQHPQNYKQQRIVTQGSLQTSEALLRVEATQEEVERVTKELSENARPSVEKLLADVKSAEENVGEVKIAFDREEAEAEKLVRNLDAKHSWTAQEQEQFGVYTLDIRIGVRVQQLALSEQQANS